MAKKTPFPLELDRPLLGFPDTKIMLTVESEKEFIVEIESPVGVTVWKPDSAQEAFSMYNHPFAHGYEWEKE